MLFSLIYDAQQVRKLLAHRTRERAVMSSDLAFVYLNLCKSLLKCILQLSLWSLYWPHKRLMWIKWRLLHYTQWIYISNGNFSCVTVKYKCRTIELGGLKWLNKKTTLFRLTLCLELNVCSLFVYRYLFKTVSSAPSYKEECNNEQWRKLFLPVQRKHFEVSYMYLLFTNT